MRIGLVIYGSLDTLSGGYLYDRKLVQYLRAQGDTIEVTSLPWRNYAAHLTDNLRFRLPTELDILIQDELNHPSLILANRKKPPYPVVSLVHHLRGSELHPTWQIGFYRFIEKQYLQSVDGFIFNSKTTENAVNDLVENRKPSIVAYPPTDRFGEPVSEEEIVKRSKEDALRILFLGNVIYRKGLHMLLKAISSQPAALHLDVVGSLTSEPAYAKLIQEIIVQNALSSFVSLHGPLDKEPLIRMLRQSHVLVVPSSYEGFGIVYLEGMGFGLPAIGTRAGAAGETIEDGQTGYLVERDDSASLAARLKLLSEDRELLTRLSINARKRYLRQPAWEVTAAGIRKFLYSLIH